MGPGTGKISLYPAQVFGQRQVDKTVCKGPQAGAGKLFQTDNGLRPLHPGVKREHE